LRHNLLISPSGRKDHFVAKDFWLEVQNCWLKFLYNKSGSGTQIENLKDVFSPNIFMVIAQHASTSCDSQTKEINELIHLCHIK
jgi:hypothetical protein